MGHGLDRNNEIRRIWNDIKKKWAVDPTPIPALHTINTNITYCSLSIWYCVKNYHLLIMKWDGESHASTWTCICWVKMGPAPKIKKKSISPLHGCWVHNRRDPTQHLYTLLTPAYAVISEVLCKEALLQLLPNQ
jgi:hypothetical protein